MTKINSTFYSGIQKLWKRMTTQETLETLNVVMDPTVKHYGSCCKSFMAPYN